MSYEPFSDGGLLIQSGIPVRIKDTGGQGYWVRVPQPEAGEEGEVLTVQPDLSADWEPPAGGGPGVTYAFTFGLPQPEWHLPFFPAAGNVQDLLGVGIPGSTFATTSPFGANVGGVTVSDDFVNFATGTGTAVLAALPVFVDFNVDPATRAGFTYSYFAQGLEIRLTLSASATVSNGRIIRTAGDTSQANAYDNVFNGTGTVFNDTVPDNVNLTASNSNTPNVTVTLSVSRTWTLAWRRYSLV